MPHIGGRAMTDHPTRQNPCGCVPFRFVLLCRQTIPTPYIIINTSAEFWNCFVKHDWSEGFGANRGHRLGPSRGRKYLSAGLSSVGLWGGAWARVFLAVTASHRIHPMTVAYAALNSSAVANPWAGSCGGGKALCSNQAEGNLHPLRLKNPLCLVAEPLPQSAKLQRAFHASEWESEL